MKLRFTASTLTLITSLAGGVLAQDDTPGLLLKGDQLLKRNKGQEAVEVYKQANDAAGGKCPECLAGMAAAFNQIGAYKQAVESAQKLIDLNASKEMTLRGYKELGVAHMKKPGDDEKTLAAAEEAFKKALELTDGAYNDGRYALGMILLRQKRDDEAMTFLNEYLEKDPRSPNAPHVKQMIARPLCGREACVPDFSMVTADGEYVTQENLKGKVTLLHFWTVWEGWQEEMWPGMKRLAMWTKKADSPVQIFGISGTRDDAKSRAFAKENGMTWPNCVDPNQKMSTVFNVQRYPTQIVVNHEGIIVYRHLNWSTDQADEVNQAISIAVNALKKAQKAESKPKEKEEKEK
jgi:tetratricopeptide (TPR) repeat protein